MEKIVVNPAYAALSWPWERALQSVEAAVHFSGGERFKQNRYRAVRRIEVKEAERTEGRFFFIKQFFRFPFAKQIRNVFCFWKPQSESALEWDNIGRVRSWGIPTLTPVARGESFCFGIERGGFLITEELPAKMRLENFLKELSGGQTPLKRQLVKTVADTARTLHERDYFHKDLYLGHFLIETPAQPGALRIYLIDLQRLERHSWLREHFRIKDLAALCFSIPKGSLSRTDQLRFMKEYLETSRLQAAHKTLIQKVLKKSRRIERHTLKLLAAKERA